MTKKPTLASGYLPENTRILKRAILYIATKLGDLVDEFVIVGGLVPSLIVSDEATAGRVPHIGTMDVDLALAVAILNDRRYHELSERLRSAGYKPDINPVGKRVSQRWRYDSSKWNITVDYLIPPTQAYDAGGKLRNLEAGFSAIITPGLELAFADKRLICIEGTTLLDEQAKREVWVCEAGAFTVLKALAFRGRGENKDAYDLAYILRNYGQGIDDLYARLKPLLDNPFALKALDILREDFFEVDSVGAMRVAEFLGDRNDDIVRADVSGAVRSLLKRCQDIDQ